MADWELAQVNIASPVALLTSPELAWFVDLLVAVLRQRRKSFPRLAEPHQALWWVPAGHRPTIREAEERLSRLREHGPTARAFTFAQPFATPDHAEAAVGDADCFCPA